MAFINFSDAAPQTLTSPKPYIKPDIPARIQAVAADAILAPLTAMERRVIELARGDGLGSLRAPRKRGWLARLILGPAPVSPRFANEQLEALRRLAVQVWHKGYLLPVSALKEAQAAGYSEDQVGAVIDTIARLRAPFRRLAA